MLSHNQHVITETLYKSPKAKDAPTPRALVMLVDSQWATDWLFGDENKKTWEALFINLSEKSGNKTRSLCSRDECNVIKISHLSQILVVQDSFTEQSAASQAEKWSSAFYKAHPTADFQIVMCSWQHRTGSLPVPESLTEDFIAKKAQAFFNNKPNCSFMRVKKEAAETEYTYIVETTAGPADYLAMENFNDWWHETTNTKVNRTLILEVSPNAVIDSRSMTIERELRDIAVEPEKHPPKPRI